MGRIRGIWKLTTRFYDSGKVISTRPTKQEEGFTPNQPWESRRCNGYTEYNDYFGSENGVKLVIRDFQKDYKKNYRIVEAF